MASPLHPEWLVSLAEAAFRSLLVLAVVGLALALLRTRNVPAQKTAWTLVLAGAMVLPFTTSWAGKFSWLPNRAAVVVPVRTWMQFLLHAKPITPEPKPAARQDETQPLAEANFWPSRSNGAAASAKTGAQPQKSLTVPAVTVGESRRQVSVPPPVAYDYPTITLPQLAFLVYIAVAAFLLARLLYGLIAALRLWATAKPVWFGAGLGLTPELPVRSSHATPTPLTIGSGIVLPADYVEWDAAKLRIVLAHEASHVWQGDFYLQLCASLYAAVVWFSPLGWWLKRKLCDLGEAISDAAALQHAPSRASYAQVLLEFAALPRTAPIGVAMARKGRLSARIERLLNERNFRQAFARANVRSFVVALLATAALFASATLVRLQAAGQTPPAPAVAEPVMPLTPTVVPHVAIPETAPAVLFVPQAPHPMENKCFALASRAELAESFNLASSQSDAAAEEKQEHGSSFTSHGHGYAYSQSSNGESYAIVRGKDNISFSGDWMGDRREQLEKARQIAHGDFLWFTRNGKAYVVDDPAIVDQITAMYKPMEDLGRQQEELGRQQEELGRQQEKLGEQMTEARVPTPDISKEMANLNAAVAKLQQTKEKTVSQDQLADLQGEIAELQGKLGALQGEMGAKQGELGSAQGKLGAQQGRLGEQQGRLGAEQGRLARQADTKVKSIIDESLKNGKARPVE